MEIKAIIVEDEINGIRNLRNMLNAHCPEVRIIGEARSIEEGKMLLQSEDVQPDLVFLDIELPDGQVFDLLDQIRPVQFEIIFVTAYDNYTKKACDYSSIGYILKPIDPDELRDAVNRMAGRRGLRMEQRLNVFREAYDQPNSFRKIAIGAIDGIYFVNIKDIIRFEAEDNYTHIFIKDNPKITVSRTIKAYEDLLKSHNFYRVHKKHVINLNYMHKVCKGDGYLLMDDNVRIDISRRRRPAFMERMKGLQAGL